MGSRDFYNVLGVPRDASTDDVKRAFRVLARRFHPDLHPGDASAEQRFKDVHEAYRVLSDPEERARYDRLGPLFQPDGRPPTPEDVGDAVGRVWSNLFGRRAARPGDDLRYTVSLQLEEVGTGAERTVVIPRRVRCGTCEGEGAPPAQRAACAACDGTGKGTGFRLLRAPCYSCAGRGWVPTAPCPTCHGDGQVGREDAIKVRVPPGVSTGLKLKIAGKGHDGTAGGSAGDLYVVVSIAEHALFQRRGDDLVTQLPLTMAEVALGADVRVPTLDGHTTIRVSPGTEHGRILRLAGRGVPRATGSGRGDLLVEVQIEVPTSLTEAERARLAGWADALSPARHPRRAAFDRLVQERKHG